MKYLFLVLFLCLLSCTEQKENENEVFLFNDIKFNLLENEKNVDLKKDITEHYLEYTSKYPFSVPLFKCIKNQSYQIFLGIPYKISSKEFIDFKKTHKQSDKKNFKTDTNSYYFEQYKQGQNYISEYLIDFEGSKIHVITVSKSEKIAKSLFSYSELAKRFKN